MTGNLKMAAVGCASAPFPSITGVLTFTWLSGMPASTVKSVLSSTGTLGASPWTWNFSGRVKAGQFAGDKVTGVLVFEPSAGQNCTSTPFTSATFLTGADGGKELRFQHPLP